VLTPLSALVAFIFFLPHSSVKSDSSSGSLSTGSSSSVRARTTRSRWALDLSEGRASSSTFLSTGHALLDVVPTGYTPGAVDGYNREVRSEGEQEESTVCGGSDGRVYESAARIAVQFDPDADAFWACRLSLLPFALLQDEKTPRDEAKHADLIYNVRAQRLRGPQRCRSGGAAVTISRPFFDDLVCL